VSLDENGYGLGNRIFLANVGANSSHRFTSPIFEDGTFEFLPIPEGLHLSGEKVTRYRDLKAYNQPNSDLLQYIPKRLWDWPAHNDPEFVTFTYGDNCSTSPRAASLKHIRPGDFLFFLARLQRWTCGRPTSKFGFYLVGFLEIDEILKDVTSSPMNEIVDRFAGNAHVRRGLTNPDLWDRFWVFRGTNKSRRFKRAVPITRKLATEVFTRADGQPWCWDQNRSDLQIIGSYTRSCRCVIDPALPGHQARENALWTWTFSHR